MEKKEMEGMGNLLNGEGLLCRMIKTKIFSRILFLNA